MDTNALMDRWSSFKQDVPDSIDILELRRLSVDDLQRRLRRLLKPSGEACGRNFEQGQWTTHDDRTFVQLAQGASAVVYHASGAMKLHAGLAPMEALFKEPEGKGAHIQRGEACLKQLAVHELLGRGDSLAFERLWQVKAAGADREGRRSEPVLCRAVAAFRQHVQGIPVLGPASVAVQMAGEGLLDGVTLHLRGPASETIDKAKVLAPERAARALIQQLGQLVDGRGKAGDARLESRDGLRFGYYSLGKRKSQRLLAPVYVASVEVTHEQVSQAYMLVVSATEKNYLPLNPPGSESVVNAVGKLASRKCC